MVIVKDISLINVSSCDSLSLPWLLCTNKQEYCSVIRPFGPKRHTFRTNMATHSHIHTHTTDALEVSQCCLNMLFVQSVDSYKALSDGSERNFLKNINKLNEINIYLVMISVLVGMVLTTNARLHF